jgi:hypothetical protein
VDKLKELKHRKELNEFDIDDYNFEREMQRNHEEKICNEYLMINLLVEVSRIRAHNIVLFNEVFKRTACDEFGNLKKAILHNSSEIQPLELSHFVIEKHKERDVFTIKKIEIKEYKSLSGIDRKAKKEEFLSNSSPSDPSIIDYLNYTFDSVHY